MNTEEWNEKEYNWQKVDDFYSRLIGENGFFSFEVIGDLQTHNYILFVSTTFFFNYFEIFHLF